jgi:nucleotide-binding universal stress UspA family protein
MRTLVVWVDGGCGAAWSWAEHVASVTGGRLVVAQPGGPPLLAVADREDADLVVGGSESAYTAPGLFPENVGDHLAHHSRRPFAVVPPTAACRAPRRLAIGTDGSPASAAAVAWCARIGRALGATVVAIDVVRDGREEAERELAGHWTEPLLAAGVKVARVVVDGGSRGATLLAAADEAGADAIVIGARALRGVRLLHHEGVTLQALHRSHLPVIAVPTERGASVAYSVPERMGEFVSGGPTPLD